MRIALLWVTTRMHTPKYLASFTIIYNRLSYYEMAIVVVAFDKLNKVRGWMTHSCLMGDRSQMNDVLTLPPRTCSFIQPKNLDLNTWSINDLTPVQQ